MKTLSVVEFVEMLFELKRCAVVSIVASPDVDLLKTGNPWWDPIKKTWSIRKTSHVNGMINWSYQNAVNNQRMREDKPLNPDGSVEHFVPLPRSWGERIEGTPFIKHKDKLHSIELKVERSVEHHWYDSAGNEVPEDQVKPFYPKKSESSRQGVDKKIRLRDYKIDNIHTIRMNGEEYSIK